MTVTGTKPSRLPFSRLGLALALGVALGTLVMPPEARSQAGAAETGIWYDDTGQGAVELKPCGQKLCGYIVWLQEPISTTTGKPKVDAYNPEPGKRSRPICGLQILGDLARQPDGGFDEGWVYDPKVGKSYDAAIELEGKNRLTLTGYKGVKFLGKSFTWTRAPADLQRCATTTTN